MSYLKNFVCLLFIIFIINGCSLDSNLKQPEPAEEPAVAVTPPPAPFPQPVEDAVKNQGQEISTAVTENKTPENEPEADSAPEPEPEDDQVQAAVPDNPLDKALDYCQAAQEFWHKGDLENALQSLDDAYALILKVDTTNNPKLIQQKEDLRFLISKRILEIYASRNTVVNGNHNAIPLTMNKHVQAEIDRFTKGMDREFFLMSYKRSGMYRQYIAREMKKAGLPESLSWLPLIESGFKTGALSRARALGLWQFISSTGYKFGLKRDIYVDERLDPVKSTKAAIAYLKELHNIFGDWTTVLAAYNCGEGRVLRIIRTQNVNYLDNFWDLYERLPWETARYVPKFLATLHIIQNPAKYGFNDIKPDPPLKYDTVNVTKRLYLKQIAAKTHIPLNTLLILNPELRYKMLPPETYSLRVPVGDQDLVLAKIKELPSTHAPRRSFVYHRVRRGQSLSNIARKYHTTIGAISRVNNIRHRNYIVAGKLLKIPLRGSSASARKIAGSAGRHATIHIVRRGDSLWNVARRYGTTTKTIQKLNNLKNADLHIGQVLKLPGYKDQKASGIIFKQYRVKPGDNPFTIAMEHNMSVARLLRINHLNKRSRIYPGQKVYVE